MILKVSIFAKEHNTNGTYVKEDDTEVVYAQAIGASFERSVDYEGEPHGIYRHKNIIWITGFYLEGTTLGFELNRCDLMVFEDMHHINQILFPHPVSGHRR